jgi:maltose O-acetyltransferase
MQTHKFWKVLALLKAKFFLRKCAKLGALPRLYGRHPNIMIGGTVEIGDKIQIMSTTVPFEMGVHPGGKVLIGDQVFINYGVSISAHQLVSIGNRCQIGSYCCLMDNDYHSVENRTQPGESKPIVLEENVWLGVKTVVLKGVTIGRNSVIGAGSVVTKNIPANCLAAGVPARVVKTFDQDAERQP